MTPEQLVTHIRDARIYNIRQLEIAAGLSASTLARALSGERKLTENAAMKVMQVLHICGIIPVDLDGIKAHPLPASPAAQ